MSEVKGAAFAYPRLCIAYFLQFAIWGSWAGALGGYAGGTLQMPGWQIGWLYAAIPLGAVISPMFIGPIADRYFSAQKVVSLLHFIGGLCLIGCGAVCLQVKPGEAPFAILMTLILLSGICFMPTIALVNSIVFKHSREGSAPYVFVFGTFGWIVVNLVIAAFLGGATTPNFFFAGGGLGVLLALYSLTLPDTPPKGAPAPGEKNDVLGLGALKLFKDPGFAIFVFCAFLASIPACNFYFPFQVPYLSERGYPSPVALTTINQFSELLFMSLLPLAIGVIGLKWVLVLGIGSWSLRYFIFMMPGLEWAILGLLLHGFAYSFLYVAAYMYADKKSPPELKASTQSLMAFLLLGVGQVLGSQLYGYMSDRPANLPKETKTVAGEALPAWSDAKMVGSAWRYLDLSATVDEVFKGKKAEAQSDLLSLVDTNKDNVISSDELAQAPETLSIGGTDYAKSDLEATFRKITEVAEGPFELKRDRYLTVQSHDWNGILFGPACFITVFFVVFLIFGKDPDKGAKNAKASSELKSEGPKEDPAAEASIE